MLSESFKLSESFFPVVMLLRVVPGLNFEVLLFHLVLPHHDFALLLRGGAVCDEQDQVPNDLLPTAFFDQNFAVGVAGVCAREEQPLV